MANRESGVTKVAKSHDTSRRDFLRQASLLFVGAQAASVSPWVSRRAWAQSGTEVTAETNYGKIRGTTNDGIKVFKGVPYGADTSGKNRFMPPQKPVPWTGVRDALAYGPSAPQLRRGGEPSPVQEAEATRPGSRESEDCLVLNVWTPAQSDGGKRPVMLWLHGGGFTTLSGSSPLYDGTNMCTKGNVVVITINHRLNVCGYTHLGDLGGSDFANSGAVGMLDVVAALQWVRDHAERFGGDPNRVLVFGQSGGGRKTSTLLSMPDAKGLLHRAVVQSGSVLRLTAREDGTKAAEILMSELGLKPNQVRELQNVPIAKLIAAQSAAGSKIRPKEVGMAPCTPVIGSPALPGHPWDPAAPAVSADVPIMVGYTRTEETYGYRNSGMQLDMDEATLKQRLQARFGQDLQPVVDAFKKANPKDLPWDLLMLILTDYPRGTYSRELSKRKSEQKKAPAYCYRFDWETPIGNGHVKSPHAIELPFVFDNTRRNAATVGNAPETHALAEKVSAMWMAFAKTGNPDVPGMPHWEPYTASGRDMMLFNNTTQCVKDPDREQRLLMEKILKLS